MVEREAAEQLGVVLVDKSDTSRRRTGGIGHGPLDTGWVAAVNISASEPGTRQLVFVTGLPRSGTPKASSR